MLFKRNFTHKEVEIEIQGVAVIKKIVASRSLK